MENIYSFYNSILNIANVDKQDVIRKVVLEEKSKLLKEADSLEGFCIYIAVQIEHRLQELGITSYYIDLTELVGVDHTVLIAEYKCNDEIQRMLIDPTFEQFTKKDNKQLLKLKEWPSEKLNDLDFLASLLTDGCYFIDNDKFNRYINAFSDEELTFDLNEFLLNRKINEHRQII